MSRRSRRVGTVTAVVALGLGVTFGGGCAHYRSNPTPGVNSLGVSKDYSRNRFATMIDTNLRAVRNDGTRFWLLDRPSRLHPQPAPY